MYTVKQYLMAESAEQAYTELMKSKNNVLLGGCGWLKMSTKRINTAIDLSKLGLDTITETDSQIILGCMATLRQLETSEITNKYFDGILSKCVRDIVGVQFRNCATVGGSVFSRFGFSDILTALLCLDSYVELYKGGIIPMSEFAGMPYQKDMLVNVIINKNGARASYHTFRNTRTDFPVLAVAASKNDGKWKISVGARPSKARLAIKAQEVLPSQPTQQEIENACELVCSELNYGTNQRASAEYRKILANVLVKKAVIEIL